MTKPSFKMLNFKLAESRGMNGKKSYATNVKVQSIALNMSQFWHLSLSLSRSSLSLSLFYSLLHINFSLSLFQSIKKLVHFQELVELGGVNILRSAWSETKRV